MNYQDVVGSSESVSAKIRKLDEAGLPRADIARLLGKRYQHVRNVLEADRAKSAPPAQVSPPEEVSCAEARTVRFGDMLRLQLDDDLSLRLPADLVAAFGFRPGSIVIGEVVGETIVISSRAENIRRVQQSVRRYVPEGVSLVDELIADRRQEHPGPAG